ncbi:MAG TPA: glycosyltransferase, partial [Nitrospiria bacterium]|nr:glycosyltransferase [Nitrospiria bacterium]
MTLLQAGKLILELASFSGGVFVLYFLWIMRGEYVLRLLEDHKETDSHLPSLSIVVPARNEEARVQPAVQSLLDQDYPGLRVIAVNDRSSDQTGRILDRLAQESSRLEVVHIETLPDDWLGKPHALQSGLERADGSWVLFTDGDVVFDRSALRRAVNYAEQRGLDHLVVFPNLELKGPLEQAMIAAFGLLFAMRQRLGEVSRRGKKGHVGAGAFNLVRRSALDAIGEWRSLRYSVIEDVELGRRVKEAGFSQALLMSRTGVRVRWAEGVGGIIKGLTKNAFSVSGYNPFIACVQIGAVFFTNVLAPLSFLSGAPWTWYASGALWVLLLFYYRQQKKVYGTPLWAAVFHPLASSVFCYIMLRSMSVTLWNRGVTWRDT